MTNLVTTFADGIELLKYDDVIAFDCETTGLSPWDSEIALIQMYGDKTKTPVVVRIFDLTDLAPLNDLFAMDKLFVGHNISGFDLLFQEVSGTHWEKSRWYDTLIGECIISTTGRRDVSKSLRASVKRRTGTVLNKDIVHGAWRADELSSEQMRYAIDDVTSLHELRETQLEKAKASGQLEALQMEMDLIPCVVHMTCNGVPLKREVLRSWLKEQEALIVHSRTELHKLFGDVINLGSTKQVQKKILELTGERWGSTRHDILMEHAAYGTEKASEIAKLLLDYREPAQRLNMYDEEWMDKYIVNDFVHPRFWSVGADTLRFSSSNPNFQQIPRNGRKIIGNFGDSQIVSVDYSQIEVRIAAHYGKDELMTELLKADDVHTAIGSQIFEVSLDQVTRDQRRDAKAAVFTLLFGGGVRALYNHARSTGATMDIEHATMVFNGFFEKFKGINSMREKAYALSAHNRLVTIKLPNGAKRLLVGRKNSPTVILNTLIQGSAAIGMKQGMLVAYARGLFKYIGLQVHDELVATVPLTEAKDFGKELSDAMIEGMEKTMPGMYVKTEVKSGSCWS